jgi:CTP:molybdopterin cytidylyltransferase MocA
MEGDGREGARGPRDRPARALIHAVVLAAGASSRYGTDPPKQAVFLPRVLDALRASRVDAVVVVAGAHPLETYARVVSCPDWERGPGASLRCGLAALPAAVEAAVVVLADGPNLSPAAIERVLEVWHESSAEIVAATYQGNRGHPVVLARSVWEQIPDEGARPLPALLVPCDDLGAPGDVDSPEDL